MHIRALVVASLLAVPVSAQLENPEEKIRELAQEVAEEMQEIDRLLLRSGRGDRAASEGIQRAVEGMEKLLEQTSDSQGTVIKKMDALIQQILKVQQNQSQSQSQSQSQQQQQRQQQQRQQQQQQRSERQRNQQQQQPNPDQQPDDPQRNENGQDQRNKGQNKAAKSPSDDPTGKSKPGTDTERWGDLQGYEEFLKSRGGAPKVPDKYRRYHEAFLKQGRKTTGSNGGTRRERRD